MRMDYSVFRMLCKESVPVALIFKMIKYIILWKSIYLSAERFNLIVIIITVGSMYNKIILHNGSVNGAFRELSALFLLPYSTHLS